MTRMFGHEDQPRGPDGRWTSGGEAAHEAQPGANRGGPNGRDLGNPAEHPREEEIRQQVLAAHNVADKAHADAKTAVDHANALIRAANADKSQLPAALAARAAAAEKIKAAKTSQAEAAAKTHALIAVPNGARVNATTTGLPLANGSAAARDAGKFLAQVVSKDAAPANVNVQVLAAGDKIPSGTFAGRTFDGRAHADPIPGVKQITCSPEVRAEVLVHEFGHEIEAESGAHFKAAVDFLAQRTSGTGGPKPLSELAGDPRYGPKEKALEDTFDKAYVGKVYEASGPGSYRGLGATEVTSMGIERLMKDPAGFARSDPHYFRFTLAQLSRNATPRMSLKG